MLVDCDGVLTPKKTFYSAEGKLFKVFDSDDSYALKSFIQKEFFIIILTADAPGFPITMARAKDWGIKAVLTDNKVESAKAIISKGKFDKTIYIGNGPEDQGLIDLVDNFFAPQDSRPEVLRLSNNPKFSLLQSIGGDGVLWEAYQRIFRE